MSTEKLRWGVLGTARINEKLFPHFATSSRNKLQAIASRDPEKALASAARFGIPVSYGNYADLLEDPTIDVVYLSLPNYLHAEWTEASLLAGKHVLCEKPLTLETRSAERLTALAREKKLKLGEGYMYRHHAQSRRVLELVRSGALGEIRRIQGSFHITIAPGPNIRTDGRLGGGAISDVGCYLVNFSNAIVGRGPEEVFARGRLRGTNPVENYDTLFSALLDYGDGVTAQLDGGFLGPRIDELRILGEKGWLEIPHPFKPGVREVLTLFRRPNRDSPTTTELIEIQDEIDPYQSEIENFAVFIRDDATFPIGEWESVAGVSALVQMAKSIRT